MSIRERLSGLPGAKNQVRDLTHTLCTQFLSTSSSVEPVPRSWGGCGKLKPDWNHNPAGHRRPFLQRRRKESAPNGFEGRLVEGRVAG
jgi:hypothetical protein